MNTRFTKLLLLLTLCSVTISKAQENEPDTLRGTVARLASDVDALKRIKISGYFQAQFQVGDSMGMNTYAGGAFPSYTDKRFQVRRGRFKTTYTSADLLTQGVIQIDVTEKGVTIKDVYLKFTDPWSRWFSLQAGMQNRPFGYEIPYSSSSRETPERGRMSQIIFPNERDLGAELIIQGPKGGNWEWLKLEAGMFNGTGAPGAGVNTSDFDKYKDFIGHLSATRATIDQRIKYGIGVSVYNGGYRTDNDTVFSIGSDSLGAEGFVNINNKAKRTEQKRKHYGADVQFSIEWIAGITTLRGEYIQGDQPGFSSSTASPAAAVTSNVYNRKFNGAYFYFIHNIAATPLQAVVKYDWYDPNTDVKGDEIGKKVISGKAFNATDVRYDTWGFGLAYLWDANVKITAYYDMIKNETSANLAGYNKDLKDNLFTLRVQYKF